ncbi:unnamed protein product [Closterium sp. NIES-54]
MCIHVQGHRMFDSSNPLPTAQAPTPDAFSNPFVTFLPALRIPPTGEMVVWMLDRSRRNVVCKEIWKQHKGEAVVRLLDQFKAGEMSWNVVRKEIRKQHKGRLGGPHQREAGENPKLEENFYANPMPGCMCEVERQPGKAVKACRMEGGQRKCRDVPQEEEAYI